MSYSPIFYSFDSFEVFETLLTFEVLTLRFFTHSARPSFNVCIVSCYVFKPLTMFGARLVGTQKNLRLAVFLYLNCNNYGGEVVFSKDIGQ